MTLNVTVPDTVYRQIAELTARQHVSVERIVAAASAEQLSAWSRVEQIAGVRFGESADRPPAPAISGYLGITHQRSRDRPP